MKKIYKNIRAFSKIKKKQKEETKTKTHLHKIKPKKKPSFLFNTSLFFYIYLLKELNSFTSAEVADASQTCLSGRGSACSLFQNLFGGRLTMDRERVGLYPTINILDSAYLQQTTPQDNQQPNSHSVGSLYSSLPSLPS